MINMFHVFGGFLVLLGFIIKLLAPSEKGDDPTISVVIAILGVLLLAFPGFASEFAMRTQPLKEKKVIQSVQDEIKNQIGLKAVSLKTEEVIGDLKDGYYVLPPEADMEKVKETLSQNEVLVYGVLPERGGEIHFVTIRDSKALKDLEFKGEDAKYFEKEKQPERENLFRGQ